MNILEWLKGLFPKVRFKIRLTAEIELDTREKGQRPKGEAGKPAPPPRWTEARHLLKREVSMTADEFKAWRSLLGLSVREAAEVLGISRSSVEVYELGHRKDDGRPAVIPKHIGLACAAVAHGLSGWRPLRAGERMYEAYQGVNRVPDVRVDVVGAGDCVTFEPFIAGPTVHLSYGDARCWSDLLSKAANEIQDRALGKARDGH